MPRIPERLLPLNNDDFEEYLDEVAAKQKIVNLDRHRKKKAFGQNHYPIRTRGRPHHLDPWLAGVETETGYRRK